MLIPRNPMALTWQEVFKAIVSSTDKRQVAKFKQALSNYLGTDNIELVSSGRLALYIILSSLLQKGDRIIVPAYTCNVIIGALKYAGVEPVFADVDIQTFNMNLEHVKEAFVTETKAILMTHQFGLPCDVDEIIEWARERRILVIEDAGPAFGARYKGELVGRFGDVGFFSFEDSKVISTFEGGIVLTRDDNIFARIGDRLRDLKRNMRSNRIVMKVLVSKVMKNHSLYPLTCKIWQLVSREEYFSSQMLDLEPELYANPLEFTPFQAALGLLQLDKTAEILRVREETARYYAEVLKDIGNLQLPSVPQDRTHTFSRYPILLHELDRYLIYHGVRRRGVDLGFTFPYVCAQYYEEDCTGYKNSTYVSQHVLNIPVTMDQKLNERIVHQVRKAVLQQQRASEEAL